MTDERDELWRELGVDNQTAAIVRIRGLIERDERRSKMPHQNHDMPDPDKKGTFIIGAIVAAVIALAAIAWHNGMLN